LVIAEMSRGSELDSLLRKVASLHGTDTSGLPLYPIESLFFHAHGSAEGLLLDKSSFITEEQGTELFQLQLHGLDESHISQLSTAAECLESDAFIGIISCSAGQGGAEQANLFTWISDAFPGRSLTAARGPASFSGINYATGSRVPLLEFASLPEEKTLRKVGEHYISASQDFFTKNWRYQQVSHP